MLNTKLLGHMIAFITVFVWGTTFIATKILLTYFTPLEVLVYRFVVAYFVLWIIYPKIHIDTSFKEEFSYFILGFSGIFIYFFLENIALTYTSASNVGLIMSTIPIFVSIISILKEDGEFRLNIVLGIFLAMAGAFFIITNGNFSLHINPIGDGLAFVAAIAFAFYSIFLKNVARYKRSNVYVTRKIFFYGLLCTSIPSFWNFHEWHPQLLFLQIEPVFMILFLGVFASALCFFMWSKAIEILGTIGTSNYIYLIPLIAIITAIIVLHEVITPYIVIGGALTLLGVYITELKRSILLHRN